MDDNYTPTEQTKVAQAVPMAEPVPMGQQYPDVGQPMVGHPE